MASGEGGLGRIRTGFGFGLDLDSDWIGLDGRWDGGEQRRGVERREERRGGNRGEWLKRFESNPKP